MEFVTNRNINEPISANGTHIITINENLGDSNCIAITRNTKNTAVRIAFTSVLNSSIIICVIALLAGETVSGNTVFATMSSIAICAS